MTTKPERPTYYKDSADKLDYEWDWATWLTEGETITTHTVTAPEGITLDSSTAADNKVTAWLSGGTTNKDYNIACRIDTNQGRTVERSLRIVVGEL